ncbi:hypothetical protein NXS13_07265 [Corynebacterium sp. ES2730-CONJ]|uniref:ABC-three component system protein n=1 Tax=Corynebacterium sp. ES2730-CONJ TaxID=2973941 RepID=UPI00216B1D86|nr:ABC-three component system protein [Corynebacterium sp. ES2730-CONJ]MCS4532304.1 hypothetical protein [Corynebacterium sp. ES2730-CONJ]
MIMIDSAWKSWYRAMHYQRCLADGDAFEDYVTKVLTRLHDDYLNPTPMGKLGDGGCDGIADNGSTVYACYGQRAKTGVDKKTRDKLASDFARAISNWSSCTIWRFVTNATLGPLPVKTVIDLQAQHAPGSQRPIKIEVWESEDLWWNAVNKLTLEKLDEVIPGIPHAPNVDLDDLVALILSLEDAGSNHISDIRPILPVPATKMDFNNLPETTRAEFNEGRLLSARIDKWFSEQADPELRDEKARRFRVVYQDACKDTQDVREIVRRIYGALGGQDFDLSTKRANAVYAVTAYFFDSCDIFEEPPAQELGG